MEKFAGSDKWTRLVLSVFVIGVVRSVYKLMTGLRAVGHLHGYRVPFQAVNIFGAMFPTCWWNPGTDLTWTRRFSLYESFGSELFSIVPFLSGAPAIYTSNLDVVRQVVGTVGEKAPFMKSTITSTLLSWWGPNLVTAEGDLWRKHRRIIGPAFNNNTFNLVWEHVCDLYEAMVECEGWSDKKIVDTPTVDLLTAKLALLVIANCGFGLPFTWTEPPNTSTSSMSIQEALRVVSQTILFALSAPKWMWNLPFGFFKRRRLAYDTLYNFFEAEASNRKERIKEKLDNGDDDIDSVGRDIFSLLVLSNEAESAKLKMDKHELIGNMYLMLLAGYETTAHSLTATLIQLCLNESVQDEIYEHIISVIGTDRRPTFQDYQKLDKVLAAFYEGSRMILPTSLILRDTKEDTVLLIPKKGERNQSEALHVGKGTQIVCDLLGIYHNPRHFPEPDKFKPSRWYGLSPHLNEDGNPDAKPEDAVDNVIGFSVGPRSCIGRKFATTEAVAFLSLLLRDWKVEPLMRDGETKGQWEKRIVRPKLRMALAIRDVPLRLVRRK